MGKRLLYWELAGALFTAALGTLLHFAYAWSGGWSVAAAFAAVNESTWEHMKLLFFPLFLFSVVQLCCLGRTYPNFWRCGASALTGVLLIPVAVLHLLRRGGGPRCCGRTSAVFYLAVLGPLPWISGCWRRGGLPPSGSSWLGLAILWGLAFFVCIRYLLRRSWDCGWIP